ncbi:MAG TPA: DNA-binding protein [Candidatus Gallimonas gallistercoris]|mgnify:FL=1|uniref:DNA-binding protein n=1 Tax=Candidatus Gallimonas gallistercoris TaxID=2838602 RepID=A0A9D2H4B3_9FIRM|nr:DNA-binding protein [Candidatus Gallimonas gallistercoris]
MDLTISRLLDVYGPLLTENKREVAALYFNFDLSLAEIAEEKGCSRQSISDTLAKVRRQLEEYEEKLHLYSLLSERAKEHEALEAFAQTLPSEHAAALLSILSGEAPDR